ncbi:pyrimidine-nucleoside phosphorylase [Entomoplasma freundtii]|uniref:Thymidine phosphorylase n=1 Tax=Entomoplasma freundtii TaxID=74700 RepID=A0A2K8NRT9_9MOLU|nr:thymidine phosphorylase [Entomoplasma freundtii]ATZ16565.1 thymidine phosphorylase [Entomoplasma freundtii]TDY58269.1 pyrimidine-nucleoside phosphorylase [Entomoplasma freundtii]
MSLTPKNEKYTFKEIMERKKRGEVLTLGEFDWIIANYLEDVIKDYQMSAFIAAIFFKGMTDKEVGDLTSSYLNSGITYNLDDVPGWKADKHSTGGVGDKITLIFTPLAASYGIKVAKLSGRALGQTGGTLDKLDSFPGFRSDLSETQFKNLLKENGMVIAAANHDLAPADAEIYALRDATQLIDSLPLIAASIMAKKLAIKTNSLILDVKVGSGAFMKDKESATALAKLMINIGKHHHRDVEVLLTDMEKPLGRTIGNALEVKEAWETLHGNGEADVIEIATTAVALTLVKAKVFANFETAKKSALSRLQSGQVVPFFKTLITAQGGDISILENYNEHFPTKNKVQIKADQDGYISYHDALNLGFLNIDLGGGRLHKTDVIDYAAGIIICQPDGSLVKTGDVVMELLTNKEPLASWTQRAQKSFTIDKAYRPKPVIEKIIN